MAITSRLIAFPAVSRSPSRAHRRVDTRRRGPLLRFVRRNQGFHLTEPLEKLSQLRQVFLQRCSVDYDHTLVRYECALLGELVERRKAGWPSGQIHQCFPRHTLASARNICVSFTATAEPPLARMISSTLK